MKRGKILKLLQQSAEDRLICSIYHKGKPYYTNCWPLLVSEELLICAHDGDFLINGCGVYAIDSIARVVIKENKCLEISRAEGVPEQIVTPDVAYESWTAFFASLPEGQLIGVDRIHPPEGEAKFVVGHIVKTGRKRLHMRYVDSEGEWIDEVWRIRYEDITGVTFGDRYLNTFAKYLASQENMTEQTAETEMEE